MKADQIVRSVGMIAVVALYGVYLALNGSGIIRTGVPGIGEIHPLAASMIVVLMLAFPELVNALPFGPTRNPKKKP